MEINLIKLQDEYVAAVHAAYSRWSHRRGLICDIDRVGGHYTRTVSTARHKAIQRLVKAGWTQEQARLALKDAHDVALLERNAEEV